MLLDDLLFETRIHELVQLIMEAPERKNNTVASWASKYNMKYEDVYKIWEQAEAKAGKGNWGLITHIFKRMFTSLKNVDARTIKTQTGGKFDYKVRTKQSLDELTGKTEKKKTLTPAAKKQLKNARNDLKDLKEKSKTATPATKLKLKEKIKQAQAKIEQIKAKAK